ncbi:MAG: Ycf34 family protein [Gemmatimonadaceae bacterium]|nr:Ycf34 family protein [Gloeobacterales cyanobacterium ES-bin-141]
MCICINCAYVDRCETYHQVESVHQQPHLTKAPDFEPSHPTINVNIYNYGAGMEWDVVGCDSFTSEPGRWSRLRPGELIPT